MAERGATTVVAGAFVAVGLVLSGFFIGKGFERGRAADRFVTVRGFSEREVAADLVVWPVSFTVTATDLSTLQSRVDEATAKIRAFLTENGFAAEEIGTMAPRVQDRAGQYNEARTALDRYLAEAAVTVRTAKIAEVRRGIEQTGKLVKEGVAIVRSYERDTDYFYTKLEQVKPEMIAEATKDARRAAEQFAADSGATVGSIRNAQQGLFTIEDRDPFSPEFKKIRVVTTVQYLLEAD